MSQQRTSLLERFRLRASRRLSQAGLASQRLHDRLLAEFDRKVRHGLAPDDIQVLVHPNTYARLAPAIPTLRAEILAMFDERCSTAGYETPRRRHLIFVPEPALPIDVERIAVGFTYDPEVLAANREIRAALKSLTTRVPVGARFEASPSSDRQEIGPAPVLRLSGGRRVPVPRVPFTIGRAPGNDLVLTSTAVSRHHAELIRDGNAYLLRDLGSQNGLLVDGLERKLVPVAPGITVRIGDIEVAFEAATS